MLKIKFSMGIGGSPDVTNLELTKPSMTESDSEQEQNEKSGKVLSAEEPSNMDNKQLKDGEKGSSDAEESKEEENDSKDTQSDHVGGSPLDADGSNCEAVFSSDMKHLDQIKEQSGQEDEEMDTMDGSALTDEADKKSPTSLADAELSDYETLSTWKQRAGKILGHADNRISLYAIVNAHYDQDNIEVCKDVINTKSGISHLALHHTSVGSVGFSDLFSREVAGRLRIDHNFMHYVDFFPRGDDPVERNCNEISLQYNAGLASELVNQRKSEQPRALS